MLGDEIPCWSNEAKSWWANCIRKLGREMELTEQKFLQEITHYRDICRFMRLIFLKNSCFLKSKFLFLIGKKVESESVFSRQQQLQNFHTLIISHCLFSSWWEVPTWIWPGPILQTYVIILYITLYNTIDYYRSYIIPHYIILWYCLFSSWWEVPTRFWPGTILQTYLNPGAIYRLSNGYWKMLSFKDKHLQIIFPGFLNWYRLHCWWVNITPETSTY